MLKITTSQTGARAVIKLEGKLLEPWIEELRRSLGGPATAILLDLSALTYADAAGTQFLVTLLRDGAALGACSGFIASLLNLKHPG